MTLTEFLNENVTWTITRYANDEDYRDGKFYNQTSFTGNILLNEGIQGILDLLIGSATAPYNPVLNTANSFIGVGSSSTSAFATDTGLLGALVTGRMYKAMYSASYPVRATNTVTWRAQFTGSEANFAWNEFTVCNTATNTGKNLNRKVSAQGTKTTGQTWTVDIAVTLS
jgi:hypothetical protein